MSEPLKTPPGVAPPANPAKPAAKAPANKKADFSDIDLRKFDLTRKYDDDFTPADGLNARDHVLLYTITFLLVIFLAWTNIATLDEVSRGDGRVVPSSEVQVIQNLEGGIVDEFLVKEGQAVKAGDVLVRMRNVQAKADFAATTQKYSGILATVTRLQAEADGKPLVFSDELRKTVPDSVRAETDAFEANKRQKESQATVLHDQLAQKEQEVQELTRRISDTGSMLALAVEERNMVEPMIAKGAANKKELLDIRQRIAQQQTELNGLKNALPRSQAAVKEAKSRLDSLDKEFAANAQKTLADKTIEMNTIKQTLSAYQDKSERTEIRSPVHGTVKDLKVVTVGGVVRPGDTIMEIVPLEDQLIIEARIQPRDIAFIHIGQQAIVRMTAFDFSVYGSMKGQVTEVSPDAIVNEKGESFYRVKVKTDAAGVVKGDKKLDIMPGMQATVDIITGEKTVMQYLLKPFLKASQTALRER